MYLVFYSFKDLIIFFNKIEDKRAQAIINWISKLVMLKNLNVDLR